MVEQHGISKPRLDEILRTHSLAEPTGGNRTSNSLWNDDFDAFLDSRFETLSLCIDRIVNGKSSEVSLITTN
jgi:hypothetical protein